VEKKSNFKEISFQVLGTLGIPFYKNEQWN
jgi:hypothetical protein